MRTRWLATLMVIVAGLAPALARAAEAPHDESFSHGLLEYPQFTRPADFDLPAFWQRWCAERENMRAGYLVCMRVAPGFLAELPRLFGESVRRRRIGANQRMKRMKRIIGGRWSEVGL